MDAGDSLMLSFDTNKDFQKNYKFLIGSLLPRPIAVVSTINEDGSNNVAPFSFFTAVSARPMIVAFSPMIRSTTGELKDTPRNILREKEFVINFVTEANCEKINQTSAELPYGQDEFAFAGLTPLESERVRPKRVGESPIHFECLFRDRLHYGDLPGQGQILTGEVVKIHIKESLYNDGRIDTDLFAPVGRGAGSDWIRCRDRIILNRPS